MILVDAYSKWLEVFKMPSLTSQVTITRLRRLFAAYGLPEHIVTDNGTQFTSVEFKNFMQQNGTLHSTSAHGHPATNGLAERYVQTFKSGIKKLAHLTMDLEDKISLRPRFIGDELVKETDCSEMDTSFQPSEPEEEKQAVSEFSQRDCGGVTGVTQSPRRSFRISETT